MATMMPLAAFIIGMESGIPSAGVEPRKLFDKARRTGFANDPADRGGATMVGVTLATFSVYRRRKGLPAPSIADLRAITFDEWLDVFRTMFWNSWQGDGIRSQDVADILVDWVWSSGRAGILIPQRMLGVKADGVVGPHTLAAVNAADASRLYADILKERRRFIDDICRRRPANLRFRHGWLRRLEAIKGISRNLT